MTILVRGSRENRASRFSSQAGAGKNAHRTIYFPRATSMIPRISPRDTPLGMAKIFNALS